MDFALTEEQRALQELARDFAEKEVRPVAMERDHIPDHQACFPEAWSGLGPSRDSARGCGLSCKRESLPRERSVAAGGYI